MSVMRKSVNGKSHITNNDITKDRKLDDDWDGFDTSAERYQDKLNEAEHKFWKNELKRQNNQ